VSHANNMTVSGCWAVSKVKAIIVNFTLLDFQTITVLSSRRYQFVMINW